MEKAAEESAQMGTFGMDIWPFGGFFLSCRRFADVRRRPLGLWHLQVVEGG